MAVPQTGVLFGRGHERRELDHLLERVRSGESAALVLRGEAGIGKTALLHYSARQAAGFRVARADGVESGMVLPFAGLHELCASMLDHLDRLPAPQRSALGVALGVASGDPPNRFMVALATLNLLAEAADERPLLCLVEDAQWLDAASIQVLAFVAHRLRAESVAMVFAIRDHSDDRRLRGLSELRVAGLDTVAARALLETVMPGQLDEAVRDRLVAETRGHPLALMELSRGSAVTMQLPGAPGLDPEALRGRIEDHFENRLADLPNTTRGLLVLAAAEPLGDPVLLYRAAERLGVDPPAAGELANGLLLIGERVIFRHPLVRSAVYRSAQPAELRAAHLALAEATDPEIDPDRRVWHMSSAVEGRDEHLASELLQSAARAQARGGMAASAAFLQRAVILSEDPVVGAERALAAAQASFHAGAFDTSLRLVAAAEAAGLDESASAQADLIRGNVAFASGHIGKASSELMTAASRLARIDSELARQTYLTAWGAAIIARHLGERDTVLEISQAVQAIPATADPQTPRNLLLDGLAVLATDGHAAAATNLKAAAAAVLELPIDDVLRFGWIASAASAAAWDEDGFIALALRQAELVREAGALGHLPLYLSQACKALTWTGDFAAADGLMREAETVAAATGSRLPFSAALHLRAPQGREPEASTAIAAALSQVSTGALGAGTHAHWAAAVLYNGLGRYGEAATAARRATVNTREPWFAMWALPELVEAAVRSGDVELGRDALDRLIETTEPAGTNFAAGIEARSRALLTGGDTADVFYGEALDRLARTRLRPEVARTHLLYGEWLRQEGRRSDAREQLRIAYEMLEAIGMEAFSARAGRELAATGARPRRRASETRSQLTAQEAQIADLARDGLTNAEIGARLFLSARTVEWHLRNVFVKLGIDSRRHLAAALPAKRDAARD